MHAENPLSEFLFKLATLPSPTDRVGKSIKDIKQDAKAITDLPGAISALNQTLIETNECLTALLKRL